MKYEVRTLKNYPDNGKHQVCKIDLPFDITKGEDGFYWVDKNGVQHKYNLFSTKSKVDDRWIATIKEGVLNPSLIKLFDTKVHKDLNVVVDYCKKTYIKSLNQELQRVK